MIKLKDILFESTAPDIFVPRRMEDRLERMIKNYVRNGSKGDLKLTGLDLTKLPDILKDITVGGNFGYYGNNLTSLEGSPSSVGGNFYCNGNKLTSLAGAPKTVGRDFICRNNNLTSLEGGPVKVGGNFDCSYNNLTSLTGAPKSVGRHFYCTDNSVEFTEEQVRAVCDVKGKIIV
jgi:hypothetical protein